MKRKTAPGSPETSLTIFVVSDATGETVERMARSALVQFKNAPATVERRGEVRTRRQVRAIVREAAQARSALIIHTLVSHDLRHTMLSEARLHGVDAMDLMGPMLDRFATHLKSTPQQKPGLFKQLARARAREIEAVEFAMRHDDGQHPEELKRAEIVLVGVSRTMKTPTMLYLAYRGWFAANVPIVPEIELPRELLALPAEHIFCLTMAAARLQLLRTARAEDFNLPTGTYDALGDVRRELMHAAHLSADRGWRQIDVTGKSVEEVAREIITLMPKKTRDRGPAW
jgi:regulator of PEP synthase PpsR (kinase-PPPase family)